MNTTDRRRPPFVGGILPPSPVGAGLMARLSTRLAAAAIGVSVLATDLVRHDEAYIDRIGVPMVGLGLLWLLSRDPMTIGLRGRPLPSWRWWALATLASAAFVVVALAIFWAWVMATGRHFTLPLQVESIADLPTAAFRLCVLAPIVEELIYRAVLVPAVLPLVGRWGAVALSGIAFAGLHHFYGNPGPDNQVAGFVLAWAYVRSGAVWVPVALHALGNACALVDHVGLAEGWWRIPGVAT